MLRLAVTDLSSRLIELYEGMLITLARPGKKQATATKLGIYTTQPRSSILFLARCSNFCKPLKKKKKIRMFSVKPDLRGSNDLRVGRKNGDLSIVFFSPGNRW